MARKDDIHSQKNWNQQK